MPQQSRTFRIFVSSTFSDLKAERNALQAQVFPRLRELCQRRGSRFQAIDLRWGVREEAALDQTAAPAWPYRTSVSENSSLHAIDPPPSAGQGASSGTAGAVRQTANVSSLRRSADIPRKLFERFGRGVAPGGEAIESWHARRVVQGGDERSEQGVLIGR